MRIFLTIVLAAAVTAATASGAPHKRHPALKRYVVTVNVEITRYRRLLDRVDRLLGETPQTNVDPFAYDLIGLGDRVEDVGFRWRSICAPAALRAPHRRMAASFALVGDAFRTYAAGILTRDGAEMLAAEERMLGLLTSAVALQRRWAAALWGALVRARMPVPAWLDEMAHPT